MINETNNEFIVRYYSAHLLARFAWKLDQALKITYKIKNQMKFLISTHSSLIIHEIDKSLDRS